jgi:hypothetical protein
MADASTGLRLRLASNKPMLALTTISSISQPGSDVLKTSELLTNFIHGLDATDRFKGHFGLELTTEILTLRFAHNLLLFAAGYHLNSCPKIGVHYNGASF